MSTESPITLRDSLSSRTGIAVVVLFVFISTYAVLIQAQILAVVYLLSVAFLLWLFYRLVRAHERIAAAQERRAATASDDVSAAPDSAHVGSGVAEAGEQGTGEDDRE